MKQKAITFILAVAALALMLLSTEVPICWLGFSLWWRLTDVLAVLICWQYYDAECGKDLSAQITSSLFAVLLFTSVSWLLLPVYVIAVYALYQYRKWHPITEAGRQELEERKAEEQCLRTFVERYHVRKPLIGYRPLLGYKTFKNINGMGILFCRRCLHKEKVVGFIHGDGCENGCQCPKCGAFFSIYHPEEGPSHGFDEDGNLVCPVCHQIAYLYEELPAGYDNPVFCPRCRSLRMSYLMTLIT